jgi:hypothetical protein
MIFILAFGLVALEEADELGVVHVFVLAGGKLMPENDLAFLFPVVVGGVGLLIPLGAYRGKGGDWASRIGLLDFRSQITRPLAQHPSFPLSLRVWWESG